MQSQVIRVEGNHDSLLCRGESELIRIRQTTSTGFVGRQDVNAMLPQALDHGTSLVLVEVIADRLSHPASP